MYQKIAVDYFNGFLVDQVYQIFPQSYKIFQLTKIDAHSKYSLIRKS